MSGYEEFTGQESNCPIIGHLGLFVQVIEVLGTDTLRVSLPEADRKA